MLRALAILPTLLCPVVATAQDAAARLAEALLHGDQAAAAQAAAAAGEPAPRARLQTARERTAPCRS